MMKKCDKCNELKEIDNYYQNGNARRSYCIPCYKEHRKITDNKPESRFKKYKRDAKRRRLDFALTREQFFAFDKKNCRYCGVTVTPISLDRLNNNNGYIIGNIDACCNSCNSLKHILGESDFLEHIKKICDYQAGKI